MNHATDLAIFDYSGQVVRTVQIDGEPWFVAADISAVLGYRMASDMTRRLEPDELGYAEVRTPGGNQQMSIVSESGLYSAVFGSQRPDAKAFRRWVTGDVIPAIRRGGSYSLPDVPLAPALPQSYADALRALAAEVEAKEVVVAQLAVSEAAVAVLEPAAAAWDDLASGDGDYLVGDAAKMLCRVPGINTGQNRLYAFMGGNGWVYRANGKSGSWRAYQSAVEAGWIVERITTGYHISRGESVANAPQVRVTVKGLERLRSIMVASSTVALRVV